MDYIYITYISYTIDYKYRLLTDDVYVIHSNGDTKPYTDAVKMNESDSDPGPIADMK